MKGYEGIQNILEECAGIGKNPSEFKRIQRIPKEYKKNPKEYQKIGPNSKKILENPGESNKIVQNSKEFGGRENNLEKSERIRKYRDDLKEIDRIRKNLRQSGRIGTNPRDS